MGLGSGAAENSTTAAANNRRTSLAEDESLELAVLRLAFDAARMGWFEHDITENRMTFSEQLATIFGVGPEAFGGTLEGFFSRIHPDDRESCMGKIAEAIYHPGRFT